METLIYILNILEVALGLGFVIFLHELGHFLLAKWNGVKVEKFSIGFGPTLWGFKRGETEYVLAAVPLGGFVKMLGEGPDEEEHQSADPRAFPNKSVGARMAIISAGVIMNVLLGMACFVWAYGHGMEEFPAKLGGVVAGSPAYEAGVHAGDEIVRIDDREHVNYEYMMIKVRLSGSGQSVRLGLKRPGRKEPVEVDVEPRREEGLPFPSIGVLQAESLTLAAPAYVPPPGVESGSEKPAKLLKEGDLVVAVGPEGEEPTPVHDSFEFHRIQARYRNQPLKVVVERLPEGTAPGGKGTPQRLTVVVPPNHFVDFGFRLTIEPIASIQGGSVAEAAGFRRGDRIVKVDGRDDFDPIRLPDLCYEHAGRAMTFEVERKGAGNTTETVTLSATPSDASPWAEPVVLGNLEEPLEVPGLGLAYHIRTKIVAVTPGSPADRAGLKVGDVINSMTPPAPKKATRKEPPEAIPFDDQHQNFAATFVVLQRLPKEAVQLTVNGSKTPIKITPEPDPTWFTTLRGLQFDALTRQVPPLAPVAALQRGFDDTVDSILRIYAMLRSLFQGRVSPKTLGGPGSIAKMAYHSAVLGFTPFIHFLGMLSINLAVLNFLPIPPLDGGQMVFLAAEKVRGRPLPDSALIAGTYAGLALVLCLMAFVIFQDILREITGRIF